VTARAVALRPHALDPELRAPALQGAGAGLDAADGVTSGDDGDVRVAG
jgi:hypothetical protein